MLVREWFETSSIFLRSPCKNIFHFFISFPDKFANVLNARMAWKIMYYFIDKREILIYDHFSKMKSVVQFYLNILSWKFLMIHLLLKKLMAPNLALFFLYFRLLNVRLFNTVWTVNIQYKFCRWLDSNCGPDIILKFLHISL